MKKYLLIVSAILLCQTMVAQHFERREEAMKRIEAAKIGYFSRELDLSPQEAQAFWPVYEEYQHQMEEQKKARRAFLDKAAKQPEEMTDEELNALIDHRIEQAQQALDARLKFVRAIREILPPIKVVRYYKAEENFRSKVLERVREVRNQRAGSERHK